MPGASTVDRLRALARAALLALAALLPFERIEPLAYVGPLQLSSVELFLYLALGAWGAAVAAAWLAGERGLVARLRAAPRAHRAVAAFALTVFLSAALAPAARGPALKFALRSAGGMLLYAAAADLLRAPGAVARTAQALVAGAFCAALLAIGEARGGGSVGWLRSFHAQTFEALGHPRASGPFQYPNIAAMYLEAVAPLAVALAATVGKRPAAERGARPIGMALAALVLFVILDGVLATASRAGLVGAVAAVVVLCFVYARGGQGRAPALAALGAVLAVGLLASGSALAGRFRFWKDGGWYRAAIVWSGGTADRLPRSIVASGEAVETLELQNQGALAWSRDAPAPVALSYHWLDQAGRVVAFDGLRTALPTDVYAGRNVRVRARVRAPSVPGTYILWWDLVHEHTSWFSERGSPGLREGVFVVATAADLVHLPPYPISVGPPSPLAGSVVGADEGASRIPRAVLWWGAVAAWRTRPLLGIGPDNFRHLSGRFLGRADTDERMHANSLYFETLADLGVVGLLGFLGIVGALAATARRAAAAPGSRLLALGVAAGLGAYLLHGALDYFLEFTPTYALFWLLAGMIVAMQRQLEAPA